MENQNWEKVKKRWTSQMTHVLMSPFVKYVFDALVSSSNMTEADHIFNNLCTLLSAKKESPCVSDCVEKSKEILN